MEPLDRQPSYTYVVERSQGEFSHIFASLINPVITELYYLSVPVPDLAYNEYIRRSVAFEINIVEALDN